MIIGIAGAAGSGKDTVAGFIYKYAKSWSVAQADPMKRFASRVFRFSNEQLWGPSECRNAPDAVFDSLDVWNNAHNRFVSDKTGAWVREVLGSNDEKFVEMAVGKLFDWFDEVAKAHGIKIVDGFLSVDGPRKQLTPRYVLQTLGTEWGRNFSKNMWNEYALKTARTLLEGDCYYDRAKGVYYPYAGASWENLDPEFVCITDVRFRNEVLGIKERGGIVIQVVSPSEDNAAVEKAGVKGHKSESELKGIPQHWFNYVIVNDKSLGMLALENKVASLTRRLKQVNAW